MRKALLALASVPATGTLLTLALPLGERAFLAWFALVPLLVAFRGRGFLAGFGAGLASILFAAWLGAGGWLYAHRSGGDAAWIYASYAKYAFSFAVILAFWGEPAIAKKPAWWFAALATLLEAALLFMIPAHLALSQYRHAFWIQIASLGGVWLVSYAVWWTNFALSAREVRDLREAQAPATVQRRVLRDLPHPVDGCPNGTLDEDRPHAASLTSKGRPDRSGQRCPRLGHGRVVDAFLPDA